MYRRILTLSLRFIIALLIPIAISLPGFRETITISYLGMDLYWMPLWLYAAAMLGGPTVVGEMLSTPVFLYVLASTVMFWVAWAYWLLFILYSLSVGINRRWRLLLLALFWLNFIISILSAGFIHSPRAFMSEIVIGSCFALATLLEVPSRMTSAVKRLHPPPQPVEVPGWAVALGIIGMALNGTLVSGLISDQLHACGGIAIALDLSGCRAEYRDRFAHTGNGWADHADLNFTPDGRYLLTGQPIFDVARGKKVETTPPTREVARLTTSTDGVSATEVLFGHLQVRSIVNDQVTFTPADPTNVQSAEFSRTGKLLAIARTLRIELWETTSWKFIASLDTNAEAMDFSADDRLLATISSPDPNVYSAPRTIQLWQLDEHQLISVASTRGQAITFSPDGAVLAVAGKEISLLRVPDLSLIQTLPAEERAWDIAFSPDGTLLASAEYYKVRIRRVSDGSLVCEFPLTVYSRSVAFTPDGTALAWADPEGVRIWDWRRC